MTSVMKLSSSSSKLKASIDFYCLPLHSLELYDLILLAGVQFCLTVSLLNCHHGPSSTSSAMDRIT